LVWVSVKLQSRPPVPLAPAVSRRTCAPNAAVTAADVVILHGSDVDPVGTSTAPSVEDAPVAFVGLFVGVDVAADGFVAVDVPECALDAELVALDVVCGVGADAEPAPDDELVG
jgi:hypothetical protein